MLFRSSAEMQNYILSHCLKDAVQETMNKIEKIIEECVRKFYSEYSPILYERTYQLLHSYIKVNAIRSGNGYEAEIYFDAGTMNHAVKNLDTGDSFSNSGWSEETILETALAGSAPHGGWPPAGGNGIWNDVLPLINGQVINWLKAELIANGLPVR